MQCETCSSVTGFNYRGKVLCATCIDKIVKADFEKYQVSVMRRPPHVPEPVECEICGKPSVLAIGISSLCQKCADDAEACEHENYEIIESLEDNYIVTVHLCQDCGVRFHP